MRMIPTISFLSVDLFSIVVYFSIYKAKVFCKGTNVNKKSVKRGVLSVTVEIIPSFYILAGKSMEIRVIVKHN